jgi:Protein of unknown function (DUF2442)
MEENSRLTTMTTLNSFEVNILPRTDDHWDIVAADYEAGQFHIEFKDGTVGAIPTSRFAALAMATEADYQDLQVGPSGLILENERIEWDYAEAGLYRMIKPGSVS